MVGREELSNASWRKSSKSGGDSATGCVSVALLSSCSVIRDSKDPDGFMIVVSHASLIVFLREIKQGKFD
jgi:hypothetical protein